MPVTFTDASPPPEALALSLTQSSPSPLKKYDVFLSFRGPDVRKGFLSHLYKALTDNGIHTFRDDTELRRGSFISPALLEAIEESRFAVVVISENYATSTWCLRELVHITDYVDKNRLELIPIFFGVDPSHVKNLTGNFAKAFAEHEKLLPDHNTETVETWRKAMAKVGSISGWDSRNWNEESKLIDELVQDLSNRLVSPMTTSSHTGELLGMSTHMRMIYPLMSVDPNGVRMVGICGMGGVGKTTIAKYVHTLFLSTFDGASLIENVKRDFNQYGPSHLRDRILSEIFCNEGRRNNTWNRDSDEMKERLRGKKILLVLDDVDDIQQLKELAGEPDWFGPGSRIIITTRDRRVLDLHDVERIYEVMPLRNAQALQLFSRHEFKKKPRLCDYYSEVLSDVVQQLCHKPYIQNISNASPRQELCKIVREPEVMVFSLIELFTPEQVREHIRGLRQWVSQSKVKAEKNQVMEYAMSENPCELCAMEKLSFKARPLYCNPCGALIRRNAMHYTLSTDGTRLYFCIPCYNENRGETIYDEGTSIPKEKLEKNINLETEESWIQCDKCQAWQHQICALFNGVKDEKEKAKYTCPYCFVVELEQNRRKPLPQSAVLGAEDLPRTILSDHIEQRLFKRLKQERTERARAQGKSFDEIPTAESLVVRVVSSVDKKLEVKPRFLEIFREDNYPTEFAYKSKVVLLFQKIEGVEVCLFGMYVQEFGTDCAFPNQRRVYLSYLDFVEYFRPEVTSYNGEALHTFVYHEILIGYLEYCKLRGYTSCYIWACPPPKGEDYILYCHPEIQETAKSDELREWYLTMLRKASKEGIVAETINLYDHFFVQTGECRAKVTASRLPYFDGDYWPGAAEDLIYKMSQEKDGRKENKKGILNKITNKASMKTDLSGNTSKDLQLMNKLGEIIYPMKEDFIMVHLQPSCTHCCILMVTGNRWVCSQCKHFQICDKCYEAEQRREDRERHPVNFKDKHALDPVVITHILEETWDNDEILESEFMDFRQALLYLCQGNHYQYDTLRRAKNSSMMVLYHLHNPTTPAFITTCIVCRLDMATGQDWRCEVCPDYQVCNSCYSRHGGITHPHRLTDRLLLADQIAQNKVARHLRVVQFRKMLELLVHASQCRSPRCQYRDCRKVKRLFGHASQCKVCAWGGCILCKKMWHLLQVHAQACKTSVCNVPRCRDLKKQLRRSQQQTDSRRIAAVMKMMRQRAAEVAGSSD